MGSFGRLFGAAFLRQMLEPALAVLFAENASLEVRRCPAGSQPHSSHLSG
jgi:hypothetical protein